MASRPSLLDNIKRAVYEPLDEPVRLQLEPTNICSLDCVMCPPKGVGNGPVGGMSLDQFKTIIGKFTKLEGINFAGWGEPTLNRELYQMIDYAADLGIEVTFTTNGTFLDEKAVGEMAASKVARIVVSFDFPLDRDFEAIRRDPHFGPLLEGVARLASRKGGKKILFSVVLSKLNAHQFEAILKLSKAVGIDEISLEPVYDLRGHNVPSLSPEETRAFLDRFPTP